MLQMKLAIWEWDSVDMQVSSVRRDWGELSRPQPVRVREGPADIPGFGPTHRRARPRAGPGDRQLC